MRRLLPILTLCLLWPLAALLAAGDRKSDPVYRAWTQADLVDSAAVFAGRYDPARRKHLRFIALNAYGYARRARKLKALGVVVNSLSRSEDLQVPQAVPGTELALAWFDAGLLKIDLAALDKVGLLGSGPAPFPEPYYHGIAYETADSYEEYTEQVRYRDAEGYGYEVYDYAAQKYVPKMTTVTKRRPVKGPRKRVVALGPHLNRATAAGLAVVTETQFPIYEFRWFAYNALVEPRYHELLGLDDSLGSVLKLAEADERQAVRIGAQTRGAVLFSDVAHHNRILERKPTPLRYGRSSIHISYDFKTSIDLQNVMEDLLNDVPDAKEVIWNLPNGLQGYFVVDGKDKRLDKADGDVAANRRSRFRDTQVRTAFHCMACHLPDKGWIHIDDEVRELAKERIAIKIKADDESNPSRAKQIRQQYLNIDFNELLVADQAVVEASVRAATGGLRDGLTCAEAAKEITDSIYEYLHDPVTIDQLAMELGYPKAAVLNAAATPAIGNALAGLRLGRPTRRDQIEAVYARIATVLYLSEHSR